LIGDPGTTKKIIDEMYSWGYLLSSINYLVVPKGRDEIRVQLSAAHTEQDIIDFVNAFTAGAKAVGVL
jgi:glycine C-acetyltransferase